MRQTPLFLAILVTGVTLNLVTAGAYRSGRDERRAMSQPQDDRVATLNAALRSRRSTLAYDSRNGYLRSVLNELDVPPESQIVTFSQASLHGPLISDMYPRAIFFNEEIAVAWAPLAPTIEVIAHSPSRGPVFYTLEQSPASTPEFRQQSGCNVCHESPRTLGVPGLLMLSSPTGAPSIATDHRTPLRQRWGSWYVTGLSRRWKHQGNRVGQGWLESLYDQFNTDAYPTLYSDIAALMVFEHQAHVTNLITRVQTEYATDEADSPAVATAIDELVDDMLFVDEAAIPERIVSTSGFVASFSGRGPRDPAGRSLFQLDLTRRLFRYPLSYMIYSKAFDSLPAPAKTTVYARITAVLSSSGDAAGAALEILESTNSEFAAYRHRR